MLTVLKKTVLTAKFINTEWTPSKGAELADILSDSGMVCSFGDRLEFNLHFSAQFKLGFFLK